MLEYKLKGTLSTTTYKRYKKKYTTPPIFEHYKFNIALFLIGILTSLMFLCIENVYNYLLAFDVCLAVAYIVNVLVLKTLYQCGILNKSVYPYTKSYKLASFLAFNSQAALWRSIIPCVVGFVSKKLTFPITTVVLGCVFCVVSIISLFGLTSRTHFYNKTAQKVYNAVIEGPKSWDEDALSLMNGNLDFSINELTHPEMANHEFCEAQSKFYCSAAELQTLLLQYDEEWRKSIIYSNYTTCKDICETPISKHLRELLLKHKKNANELNDIIAKINAMEYTPRHYARKVNMSSSSKIIKKNVNSEPRKNGDFWGNVATWYN